LVFSRFYYYIAQSFDIKHLTHIIKPIIIMKELVEKINAACAEFAKNAEAQVVKGNKAAGARARKAALELMKDLKEFRKASVEAAK
jgi:hypothetical protein